MPIHSDPPALLQLNLVSMILSEKFGIPTAQTGLIWQSREKVVRLNNPRTIRLADSSTTVLA